MLWRKNGTHFAVAGCLALASVASANVLSMGGTRQPDGSWIGLASLETVHVGNAGNLPDTTGYGAVAYEYSIGKYEVTAGQYTQFLNAVAKTDTYGLYNTNMESYIHGCKIQRSGSSGSYTYSIADEYANRPVNFVSWGDAARFANWMHHGQPTGGQTLTTTEDGAYELNGAITHSELMAVTRKAGWTWAVTSEDEWYKTAYYDSGTASYYLYPTASNSAPGRDLADMSDNNANFNGSPYPIQSPYYATVVGEFQDSDSPYGTFDQGGNVWEWNEAILYASSRGLRGGSFDFYGSYLQSSSSGIIDLPTAEYVSVGFRLVAVPEPTSMGLLTLGMTAWLSRRRA